MRIPTVEAAKRLGIDPGTLILRVSELVGDFTDCWPEIDEGFVDTLRQLEGGFESVREAPAPAEESASLRRESPEDPGVHPADASGGPSPAAPRSRSDPARFRVLDKLERQERWGSKTVNWDTLRNHWCRGVERLEEAVGQLVDERLLSVAEYGNRRRGPFSLNAARKRAIQRLLKEYRG